MKRPLFFLIGIAMVFGLAACVAAPPVDVTRQMLSDRFGHQSIDTVLLAWGPPTSETHLTNGARMAVYTRTVVYDYGSWDQSAYGCKASFLAPPPDFKIESVSLDGDDYDCQELSLGHTGSAVYVRPRTYFSFSTLHGF